MTTDPNQDPRLSGQAQVGAAAGVNPNNVAPQGASLNQSQKAAVTNIVANDAAKGANVYTFDPNANPEDKATAIPASKRGGFMGGAKGIMGAPKSLGKGAMNMGSGVVNAGAGVGRGVVSAGTGVVTNGVGMVGSGAGHIVSGVGTVAGGAVNGVGAVAGGVSSQAKNALGHMPGMGALKDDGKNVARAVAIDTSTSESAPALTASIDDANKIAAHSEDSIPGTIPKTVLPGIPNWMGIGWKEVAGVDGKGPDAKTAAELSVLSSFLKEQYYGNWYHNAGIIVFSVIATRFITVIRLGWGWVFIILAFSATAYSLSVQRTRQRARDDIQRELVKTRLVTETESADWLNGFLDRFWLIYEPVLSQTIVSSVDPALEANCPGFLDSIKLTTFTLGNKAPRIDYVRTFPRTPDDEVIMDWALSFTPNDLEDVTPRQAANRVNPKIVLEIRVGKGMISTGMPILLEDINFSGKMRIKLKLMTNFPHVQKVEMSFLEKPSFDYVLKPIGGETLGFDINSIPGLAPFIRDQVHSNLGPMMYDPNVFTIDLEQLLSGAPLDSANGVLKVTIHDARGVKATKIGGGAPDPYVAIGLGADPPVARTKTIDSSSTPTWNETHFVLLKSLNDILNLSLFDYNSNRPDNLLGTVSKELITLGEDAEQDGIVGNAINAGKERGQLRYDLSYYPAIKPEKNADGTFNPVPDLASGIVRLTVHQAKDFGRNADMNTVAKVFLGGNKAPIYETKVVKKSNSPAWEGHTEFIVADKHASVVTVDVINQKTTPDSSLGRVTVKLSDILAGKEKGNDWFPLKGSGAGKIRLSADFKPVALPGVIDGASGYQAPIGVLRVWLKDAIDVKNVEAALGGKSDPYVRVLSGNKTVARTEVISSDLNPKWDQIVYVPVHSTKERLVLELMDYQNIGKDRTLGSVSILAGDFITETEDNQEFPYQSTGHKTLSERIRLDKNNQYKGTLNFEVDFKPAMSLRGGVSFDAKKNDIAAAAEEKTANDSGVNGTLAVPAPGAGSSASSVATSAAVSARSSSMGAAAAAAPPTPAKDGASPTPAEGEELSEAAKPEKGVVMTNEQLVQCQSGILVFQVISGQLARKGALEVVIDDATWPSYVSERARSAHARWDQVGEGFVRELDVSRIILRLNANDDTEKEDIVASREMSTEEFLSMTLDKEATIPLAGSDGQRSSILISARYIPVDIKLEPRESILNQGLLQVSLVGGKNLKGVDRSGKSDPNVTFLLNGMKVFKSETKKKTLHPVWNESFDVAIPSRVSNRLSLEVNDWDRVGSATLMGTGIVDLAALEPVQANSVEVPIIHDGQDHGTIQLNLVFRPGFVARQRTKTGTFSAAGRTVTTIGGAALGAPVAVGKGVGRGVGTIVSAPGRLFKKKDREASHSQSNSQDFREQSRETSIPPSALGPQETLAPANGYEVPAGQTSAPAGLVQQGVPTGKNETTLPPGMTSDIPTEPGTLTVTVLEVKDLQPMGSHNASALKPYVRIQVGNKGQKTDASKGVQAEFNETFHFNLAPGTKTFNVTALDKHSFGKDTELGEANVDIWRHIQPAVPTADVFVELANGSGQVKLRLDYAAGANLGRGMSRIRSRTPSVSSRVTPGVPETPRSSKFNMTSAKNSPAPESPYQQ